MFLHCLDNLFRYSIIKLPPLKKVNFSISNCCFPLVGLGNEDIYFRRTRQLMSKIKGNKGLITLLTLI